MAAFPTVRTILKQAGILLFASGVAALISAFAIYNGKLAEMQAGPQPEGEIMLAAVMRLTTPPLWIDARAEEEYQSQHIPEALLLNLENWSQNMPVILEKWEPGRTVVVYCNSPGQQSSREVAERLRDFKLGPVFVLHGGWETWTKK